MNADDILHSDDTSSSDSEEELHSEPDEAEEPEVREKNVSPAKKFLARLSGARETGSPAKKSNQKSNRNDGGINLSALRWNQIDRSVSGGGVGVVRWNGGKIRCLELLCGKGGVRPASGQDHHA